MKSKQKYKSLRDDLIAKYQKLRNHQGIPNIQEGSGRCENGEEKDSISRERTGVQRIFRKC
jgi:hypothetical protein